MTRRRYLLAMLAVAGTLLFRSETHAAEWRKHWEALDPKTGIAYEMTEITMLPDESQDIMYVLLEDSVSGDRLIIRHTMDYFKHEASMEVTDVQTKEWFRASIPLPYKSISRREVVAELKANPALRQQSVDSITISCNGVEATASEADWLSYKTRELRSNVRRAASALFLERLERLRVVVTPDSPLHHLCTSVLRYVLYNERCATPVVRTTTAPPNCDFDGSFKFSCSQKQKEKIARALKDNQKLDTY